MKHFLKNTFIILFLFTSCKKEICSPEDSDQIIETDLGVAINNRILTLEKFKFSGSVLVMKEQQIIVKNNYQYEHKSSNCNLSIRTENSFWIASLSKQFCASAILLLTQNNQIDLNATIPQYLDNVPSDKSGITLHQLLTHTSGLSGEEEDLKSKSNALEVIFKADMVSSPGEYCYSNYGYQLLAIIIETITNQPYEEYLEKNFFTPLNMLNTANAGDQQQWKKLNMVEPAKGAKRKTKKNPQLWDENYSYKGSTGVLTNVTDLYIWYSSLINNTILSKTSTDLLFTRYVHKGNEIYYGYGWNIFDTENGTVFSHSGYDDFIQQGSSFRYYEEKDVLIIVLHNYGKYENGKVPVLIRKEITDQIF